MKSDQCSFIIKRNGRGCGNIHDIQTTSASIGDRLLGIEVNPFPFKGVYFFLFAKESMATINNPNEIMRDIAS